MVKQCETCMRFRPKNAASPLEPPTHGKMVAINISTLDSTILVIGDYCSKMFFVHNFPPGQTSAAKTIAFFIDTFSEHRTPEIIHADNGGQYICHGSKKFCQALNS